MRTQLKQRRRRTDLAALFILFMCVAGTVLALGLTVWARGRNALEQLGPGANDLNPVEQAALTLYLSTRLDELTTPAGTNPAPVIFSVPLGATAAQVADDLAAVGLVPDAQTLNLYLRYRGYDSAIEAGDFILRQTMSPLEIAVALTDASAREVSVRLIEGWRVEQMAEALGANPALAIPADEFLGLVGPTGSRPAGHAFISELPPSASLEGFLFPDTYIVSPDISTADLVDKMLGNFERHLPDDYRSKISQRGLTLYQAITLASLIEREAALNDERPLIASVMLNRLTIGQPLQIDATVQYVVGGPGQWWPPLTGLDYQSVPSPYNTYTTIGIPAGPIANPGEASILAVANPADTNYLYYRARCDGSGGHNFAATFEEHLANACP
jgi:UPF0755 protein